MHCTICTKKIINLCILLHLHNINIKWYIIYVLTYYIISNDISIQVDGSPQIADAISDNEIPLKAD